MAKYRVTERSFINNRLVEAGEIVDYDGEPAGNLEAVKDEAESKAKGKASTKADDLV